MINTCVEKHFLLAIALFLISSSIAQSYDEEMRSVAESNCLVGMSVATVCNGGLQTIYHYGKADIARDIFVNDSTMYRIASISKTITALAAMKLWENGLFELDDNVSDYLDYEISNPNLPDAKITFRMLMSHTSSLQDGSGYSIFLSASYESMPPPNIKELLLPSGTYYTSDMWSNHEPGSYFQYSNINFGLLATLIENIANTRFDVFVKDSILNPLGIRGGFNVYELENIDNLAVLYRNGLPQADNFQGIPPVSPNFDLYELGSNGVIFAPQGGLRISAIDLSKIMQMLINRGTYQENSKSIKVFNEETIDEILETQWSNNGSNGNNYYNLFNEWGLGFQKTTNTVNGDIVLDGIEMYGHPGEAYGLISDMYFEDTKDFGLIFITNGYYNGGEYQWGNYSAFYLPEEQLFSLIQEYDFDSCSCENIVNIEKPDIVLFPNPAADYIMFRNLPSSSRINIHTPLGKIVFNSIIRSSYLKIPENILSGIYFYSIESKGGIISTGKISIL